MAAQRRKKRGGILPVLVTMVLLVLVAVYAGGGDLEAGLDGVRDAASSLADDAMEAIETLTSDAPEASVAPAATAAPAATVAPAATDAPGTSAGPLPAGEGMTLTVLEVGKADCLVLQCDGESMIIDGGNEGDEDYILEHLEDMGIEGFRYLVNTHPHEDHLGSLDAVVLAYPVEQAYLSPREHTTKSYENLLGALEEKNVPTSVPSPGDTFALGGAQITVLSPDPDADYDEINDWSLVLLAEYGDVRYLLMGDAETPVETDLLESGADLSADVLKVGHHGSSTSSKRDFLQAVSPDYAVITCDYTESAGAPHDEVAARLEELEIPVLRTDLSGVLTLHTDGRDVSVETERQAA